MKPTTILILAAAAIGIYMYTKKENTNQDAGGGTPTDKKDAPTDTYDADNNPLGAGGQVVEDSIQRKADFKDAIQDKLNGHY